MITTTWMCDVVYVEHALPVEYTCRSVLVDMELRHTLDVRGVVPPVRLVAGLQPFGLDLQSYDVSSHMCQVNRRII